MEITLEDVDCVVCGNAKSQIEAVGKDYLYHTSSQQYTIVRCSDCGHIYLNPRPTKEMSEEIYPKQYSSYSGKFTKEGTFGIKNIRSKVMELRTRPLRSHMQPGASVLDVGCGDGQLLLDYNSQFDGLDLYALDWHFSEEVRARLEQKGVTVIESHMEEVSLEKDKYDLVIMNQLIEHLWDPVECMRKIYAALKPGGIVSIETPNPEGYDRAWFRKSYWGLYYIPRHLNLFSTKHLIRMLEPQGYEFVSRINLVAPLSWSYTFKALLQDRYKLERLGALFSDDSPFVLACFTVVDLLFKALGYQTSNQKVIFRKPMGENWK